MNVKKIISKTKLFISIVAFIIVFQTLFGQKNTLIGVMTITAMLTLLSKDLTLTPIKNTCGLIIFNVLLGIISYLATINMYLAVPLNFITLFLVGYRLCYRLNTPIHFPFTLQYLFMLAVPITIDELPMRLLSLAVGAISIMVKQLISNRNRVCKYGNMILADVCMNMLNKIRSIKNNEPTDILDEQIKNSINSFRKIVYDKRDQHFYITEESRIKLNISLALEKINNLLNDIEHIEDKNKISQLKDINEDIILSIDNVKICFENENNLDNLDNLFNDLLIKYSKNNTNNLIILKLLNSLHLLKESLYELKDLDKKKYNITNKIDGIPKYLKDMPVYKDNFSIDSLRFSYAFRLALGISIGGFIMDFFHLTEGRWLLYTINSLSQPQYEISKQKSKDRVIATIIGTLIVFILYSVVKNITLRSLIVMGAGYIGSYTTQYKHNMIFVTVSAIGSAALLGNTSILSIDRILLVIFGAIITMILSKFIFPYNENDAKNDLIKMYRQTILELLKGVQSLLHQNENNYNVIRNGILISTLIEEKLLSICIDETNNELSTYLDTQRMIVINIYELYMWLNDNKKSKDVYIEIRDYINELIKDQEFIEQGEIEELVNHIDSTHQLNSKLVISNYIEILIGINNINSMNFKVN